MISDRVVTLATIAALALLAVGVVIGVNLTPARAPDCGPTGPLVAIMREQEVNATCTITGVIMDARIELVGGGE